MLSILSKNEISVNETDLNKNELWYLLISLAIVHYFVYVAPKTVNTLSIDAHDCHGDSKVHKHTEHFVA